MKNFQKGFAPIVLVAIVALLVVGGGAYVYKNNKTENPKPNEVVDTHNTETSGQLVKYENSYFPSFSYPKDFKFRVSEGSSAYPSVITLNPKTQSKEFGPFISLAVYNKESGNFLDDVKKKYGVNFVSSETVVINGRNWVHAAIRDDYFESLQYEYYFTSYKSDKYFAVIHNKDSNFAEYNNIISSVGGLD